MLTIKYLIRIPLFLFVSLLLISCGSSNVTISPNYENVNLKAKQDLKLNTSVVEVVDKRNEKTDVAGTAQVGMFNKTVPYLLTEPIVDFIEKSVTAMISEKNNDSFIPLKIIINKFLVYEKTGIFSEEGHFECELLFVFPLNRDSMVTIETYAHEEFNGMEVTNGLETLMYKGTSKCVNIFLSEFEKSKSSYFVNSSSNSIFNKDDDEVTNITIANTAKDNPVYSDKSIGFSYLSGEGIKYGIQFLYQNYDSLNRNFYGGFSYSFQYLNVENLSKYLEGSFVNFNSRYSLRYFLAESRNGLFLGGSLKLSFGTERIEYGSMNKTNFFFGPTLEEVLGISISNTVFLEIGSYQIKLFGSDLLPDDIGITGGILIGIN